MGLKNEGFWDCASPEYLSLVKLKSPDGLVQLITVRRSAKRRINKKSLCALSSAGRIAVVQINNHHFRYAMLP